MNILFIHQNFPGQFKHLAPALAANSANRVVALTMQRVSPQQWNGVALVPYGARRGSSTEVHPWAADWETKVIRGEACYLAAMELKKQGFMPDVIISHPGWGESLFLKDVWPKARLGIYCEFFYRAQGLDTGFDAEFATGGEGDLCRLRLKNLSYLMHFEVADAGIAPTRWQADTFPQRFREKITVVHDGIDTDMVSPHHGVSLTLNGSITLTRKDEVITFINRDLEPYRGYHVFMRALPDILRRRPHARVLIVGGDGVSYGAPPAGNQSWREIFAAEARSRMDASDWSRVHFLGNIPYSSFICLLQQSTVHVYLTYPFVLSWSLLEAMSAACAIVASDTGPVLEAISHNESGILVDFFDISGLADAVCLLLENAQLRERLGNRARQHAVHNYSLRKICLPKQLDWVAQLAGWEHRSECRA